MDQVRRYLRKLHKHEVPYGISPKGLKAFANQLCGTCFQRKLESAEGHCVVEDIPPRSCSQDATPLWLEGLQTCGPLRDLSWSNSGPQWKNSDPLQYNLGYLVKLRGYIVIYGIIQWKASPQVLVVLLRKAKRISKDEDCLCREPSWNVTISAFYWR